MNRSIPVFLLFCPALLLLAALPVQAGEAYSPPVNESFPTMVYWGDTHVHTSFSWDAWSSWGRISPDDAYRFAKGETVVAHNGQEVRLSRPLDFLVISDHAGNMGYLPLIAAGNPALLATDAGKRVARFLEDNPSPVKDILKGNAADVFARLFNSKYALLSRNADTYLAAGEKSKALGNTVADISPADMSAELLDHLASHSQNSRKAIQGIADIPGARRTVWEHVTANAERHNQPGRFTALIGYEWTFGQRGSSLHRNVIFADDADKVNQVLPLRAKDSKSVEDLWQFLAAYEAQTGGRALAIAHNGNLSTGAMFSVVNQEGAPVSKDYAAQRTRWEPLYEVTQIKGDGETHPLLSPTDEFADYETWNGFQTGNWPQRLESEYARSALKLGLAQQVKLGENPFKFGMIGSTDSHTSLATADEDNFWGKVPLAEPSRHRVANAWFLTASGYAAVWSTANTRPALFDAMRRREVYASTGPRITLRFFGGWDYSREDADHPNLARTGYTGGVPMGGDLTRGPAGRAPHFLIKATRDPEGANLDRIQVIKGWLDSDGSAKEKIYNVAVSDSRIVSPDGRVDPAGSTVDVAGTSYTNTIGDPELSVMWRDPDFDPEQLAFYYVRVLEIPTPRWPAFDAKYYGLRDLPEATALVTRERAYSSPIWYSP